MSEDFPQLEDLAAQAKEATMLSAHEVRRLGDRRRTTRRVGLSVAAVGLVTALGVGVWAVSPLLRGDDGPNWATSPSPSVTQSVESISPRPSESQPPTPTAPAEPVAPTWANVPTLELMFPYEGSIAEQLAQHEGMGQAAKGLCDPGQWGNPTTTLVREFGVAGELPTSAIVFGYPDAQAASEGYDLITTAALNCEAQTAAAGWDRFSGAEDGTLPFDGSTVDATPTRAAYFYAMAANNDAETGVFNDTLVMQAGERVVWLVSTFEGMDNNCSVLPGGDAIQCPLAKSMPEVLELLVK